MEILGGDAILGWLGIRIEISRLNSEIFTLYWPTLWNGLENETFVLHHIGEDDQADGQVLGKLFGAEG